ncbi:hypothetical protein G6F61_015135 [Rhizopus arrhizus]|nr:hypothetical protein G6F61_015135 [Rhizopus arrhizus]
MKVMESAAMEVSLESQAGRGRAPHRAVLTLPSRVVQAIINCAYEQSRRCCKGANASKKALSRWRLAAEKRGLPAR